MALRKLHPRIQTAFLSEIHVLNCCSYLNAIYPAMAQASQRLALPSQRLAHASQSHAQSSERLWPTSERPLRGMKDAWMDEQTVGQTDSPCILQDFIPSGSLCGHCPAYITLITATIMKYQSRARVLMTMFCFWATGLLIL